MKAAMALGIAATLGIGFSPPGLAQTANPPRLRTEPALACLLGMSPQGCGTLFEGAWQIRARRSTTYCTVEYTHRWLDNCSSGPLESVTYLGTDPAGIDVYDVKYLSADMTYVVWPPAADGRVPGFTIFNAPHNGILGIWGEIASPAGQLLYTRPELED